MKIKIVAISDSHGRHDSISLPDGDILLHAGDFSDYGRRAEVISFLQWFESQRHTHKIFVSGNHEIGVERDFNLFLELAKEYAPSCIYLHNTYVNIAGLNIFASPFTPTFGHGWAFNADRGTSIKKHWNLIPKDANILITHGPAYGVLDEVEGSRANQGCRDLMDTIKTLSDLKLHVFGHLHLCGGQQVTQNGVIFVNAAMCDEDYQLTRAAQVIDLET